MSYTKLTDFAAKDALLSGNPSKVIRGTEIDAEFSSLQTESALLAPKTGIGATGTWGISITGNAATATFATNATNAATATFATNATNAATATNATNATNAVILTGTIASAVTAVTQTAGDNSAKVATTAYVDASGVAASETVAGKIEIATAAEVRTGTDTVRAITPSGLRSGLNASGSAGIYAARAWCMFDGTVAGTNAPTAGGNVTTVTRNAMGDYTINFATALPDANYATVISCQTALGNVTQNLNSTTAQTASARRIFVAAGGTLTDSSLITVAVFR